MHKYLRTLHQWQRHLGRFIREQTGPMALLAVLFVIGVIFGALALGSMAPRDKVELVSYLHGSMAGLGHQPAGAPRMLLRDSLWGKAKEIGLLWVFGISLVGVFGVAVLAFIRGMVTGFTVAFLTAEMGAKGVVLALVGHLPQSLLEVPALILAGAASVAFSLQVIRSWKERRRVPNFYPALGAFTGTLLLMAVVLVISGAVESYLSPKLVQMAVTLMKLG